MNTDYITAEKAALEVEKCRRNLFYFIYNYVYVDELGNPLKITRKSFLNEHIRVLKILLNIHFFFEVLRHGNFYDPHHHHRLLLC
jgi:hypothetical protein